MSNENNAGVDLDKLKAEVRRYEAAGYIRSRMKVADAYALIDLARRASATPSSKDAGGEPVAMVTGSDTVIGRESRGLQWVKGFSPFTFEPGTKLYTAPVHAAAAAPSDTRALCMLAAEAAHRNATGSKAMPADQIRAIVDEVMAGAAAKTEQTPCNTCNGKGQVQTANVPGGWAKCGECSGQASAAGAGSEQPADGPLINEGTIDQGAQAATTASASGPEAFENYFCMTLSCDGSESEELIAACRAAAHDAWMERARAPLPAQDGQAVDDARDAARWRFIVKDGKSISGRFTLVRADDSGGVDELHGGEYARVIDAAMSASRPDDKGEKVK